MKSIRNWSTYVSKRNKAATGLRSLVVGSNVKRLIPLFLVSGLVLFMIAGLAVTGYRVAGHQQNEKSNVPLITLMSSERILADVPYGTALSSADDKQLYVLRRDTNGISVYDSARKRAKDLRGLPPIVRALSVSAQGHIYVATKSEVRAFDADGHSLVNFAIHDPLSLAALSNGNLAVASPDAQKLLDIYDEAGNRSRSAGKPKQFDARNPAQNTFLNAGKVVAGQRALFII